MTDSAVAAPALPYFDFLLGRLEAGDERFAEAFGRHVHWGYWPRGQRADGSPADFALAAERLCHSVCDAGSVADGRKILDAGCGFGGTIASLNARFSGVELIGLNIDPRQLERAATRVLPRPENRIRWLAADACALPLPDGSLDAVLAVECIFHFPSREEFFRGCARVLRPGGRLALSDFVPTRALQTLLRRFGGTVSPTASLMAATYGPTDSTCGLADYRALAKRLGFDLVEDFDITRGTLPTYSFVAGLYGAIGATHAVQATRTIGWLSRLGLLRYRVMAFQLGGDPGPSPRD